MEIKLQDAELKVMDVIWNEGTVSAKHIYETLKERFGYSRSTTYTLIKRCIDKGAIERVEPGFLCEALVMKEEAQELETKELINKLYDGSADKLVASILGKPDLSEGEIERLQKIVRDWEE